MALCTETDAEVIAGADIPTADFDSLLVLAAELIDGELGRAADTTVVTGETTYLAAGAQRLAILTDGFPLASIEEIREDGDALVAGTDYRADLEAGEIYRLNSDGGRRFWPTGTVIEVDYTTAVPSGIRTVCAQMIARSWSQSDKSGASGKPAIMAGLRQLAIGRWSATADTPTGESKNSPLSMTESERRTIHRWRDRRP